jgi:hypothetical protein
MDNQLKKSNKSRLSIYVLAAIFLLVGLFFVSNFRQKKSLSATVSSTQQVSILKHNSALSGVTQSEQMEIEKVASSLKQYSGDGPMRVHGIVGPFYKNRVKLILARHPEIKVTPEEAEKMQEIYTRNSLRVKKFQAALADIQQTGDVSLVRIPSFPNDGLKLLTQFQQELSSEIGNSEPLAALEIYLRETFASDNNSVGQNPFNLEIKPASPEKYWAYDVKREVIIIDPKTSTVTGIGTSYDQLNNIKDSSYDVQAEFFPHK